MPRKWILRLGTAALLGALVVPPAMMHTHLTDSYPGKDSTVTAAPPQIRLWFNEPVSVSLSRITLLAPDSSRVKLGKVRDTDDTLSVAAPVEAPLAPGRYVVQWRTGSRDGHLVKGDYEFILAPAEAKTGR
jgi:methionine-rich copper-binding protein CopC